MTEPRPRRPAAIRLLGALLLLLMGTWPSLPVVVDDLYISYAYALSLVETGELAWDGSRVEGYSNFLWVMLLAVGRAVGAPITWWAKGASLACATLLVVDAHRRSPPGWVGAFFVLSVACWSGLATWAGLGMETTAFALALWLGCAWVASGRRGLGLAALVVGALLRPEGGLYVAGVIVLLRGRISRVGWVAVAILAAYEAWRVAYFGSWIPLPVVAKLHSSDPVGAGVTQAAMELLVGGVPWVAALAAFRVERRFLALSLAPPLLHVAMLVRMHGDWMGDTRILLPGLVCGLAVLVATGTPRPRPPWLALAVAPLLLFSPMRGQGLVFRPPVIAGSLASLPRIIRAPLLEDVAFAIRRVPAGGRFETADIGLPGLVPGLRVVDALGLTDEARARFVPGLDSSAVDARYRGEDAFACVRRYARDAEADTPRFKALIAPYRLENRALSGQGGHRWWCRPDAPEADAATIRARWVGLVDRLPEHPAIRWRAARVLADQGDFSGASEMYGRDPFLGPDGEVALLLTVGPSPETRTARGFRLGPGDEIRSRPLESAVPIDVIVEGGAASISWSWQDVGGSGSWTSSGSTRIAASPPSPGARLLVRVVTSPSGRPVWVRAERRGAPR